MAHIEICRIHKLGQKKARSCAEDMATRLEEAYDLAYEWEGDSLLFERSGVRGRMEVAHEEVRVTIKLGLLMRPMKSVFEREINRHLDEILEA